MATMALSELATYDSNTKVILFQVQIKIDTHFACPANTEAMVHKEMGPSPCQSTCK